MQLRSRLLTVAKARRGIAYTLVLIFPFYATRSFEVAASEATVNQDDQLVYNGKSTSQWIELLSKSADTSLRVQAAEALGFIARENEAKSLASALLFLLAVCDRYCNWLFIGEQGYKTVGAGPAAVCSGGAEMLFGLENWRRRTVTERRLSAEGAWSESVFGC